MKSILGLIVMCTLLLGFAACGQQQQAPQGQGTLPGGTTEQAPATGTAPGAGTGTTTQAGF